MSTREDYQVITLFNGFVVGLQWQVSCQAFGRHDDAKRPVALTVADEIRVTVTGSIAFPQGDTPVFRSAV